MGTRAVAAGTVVLAVATLALWTGSGPAAASGPAGRAAADGTAAALTAPARSAPAKAPATPAPAGPGSAIGATAGGQPADGERGRPAPAGSPTARARAGSCTAAPAELALAARLSADLAGALRGRAGRHGVTVYDTASGVSCTAGGDQRFDAASVVKAIILAALLRWHQESGQPLSGWERQQATLMITESDNDAATALWDELGYGRLQHFLNLAGMGQTELGQDGYWGLSQLTAHDEMLLLELLTGPNRVLTSASRAYQLGLMARVIPDQRWGTPAGAPAGVTTQVKNGWLPDSSGWHVNSIGAFTGPGTDYMIVVLTDGNPAEQYGIDTVQAVARAVHRDLSAAATARLAAASAARTTTAPAAPAPAPRPADPRPAGRPRAVPRPAAR